MTTNEALAYIHSISWKGSVPGLSRTRELLRAMGNPQKQLRFVHVAGTNGKGSTAAILAAVLRCAGCRTGLFTSPYITRFQERMQVDGQEIPDAELAEITDFVRPFADTMEDHPTEFELVTCIALEFFARRHCDIVVLEVGMGGELDSTNVIDAPEVAVITNIGLDHMEYLGNTPEAIARAKAGILKSGTTCVYYPVSPSVDGVYHEVGRALGVPVTPAPFDSIISRQHTLAGQVFDCCGLTRLQMPLLGAHQLRNAAVAITALQALAQRGWPITEAAIRKGLAAVSWPGRFELLRQKPLFLLDGGHNPQCMQALAQNLRDYLPGQAVTMLTGVLADKDYKEMFRCIAPYARQFVTVTPPNPRALDAQVLAQVLGSFGKPVFAAGSIEAGINQAMALAGETGAVVAFGSLYMAGPIRQSVLQLP